MNRIGESLLQLLGKTPKKPAREEILPAAQEIHHYKKVNKVITRELIMKLHEVPHKNTWRNRRWLTLLAVNLLFVVSYYLDIQLLEGALTASRFMGFHMADLNSALQVMLAFKEVLINLVIGTSTVLVMWLLLGGRTFCSWVCPYHLVAEWAEKLHLKLVEKKIIKGVTFHRGMRTVLYVIVALLVLVTGYTVFETISPAGIISRALIYGPGIALVWVAFLLLFWSVRCGSPITSSTVPMKVTAAKPVWYRTCWMSPSRGVRAMSIWPSARIAHVAACAWTSVPQTR